MSTPRRECSAVRSLTNFLHTAPADGSMVMDMEETFMKNTQPFWLVALMVLAVLPAMAGGRAEQADGRTTVTLGYNPFLADSFTDAPPPIDVMRAELSRLHPDIDLEYYTMPQDMLEALVIWMTSRDTTVDIYGIDEPWVTQFGRAGWALPLNDRIPELEERLESAGLDTFSYQGDRLGVPFWGSLTGLFYRADILDQYGFAPPATIDAMVEIITTVLADESDLAGFLWPGARSGDSLNMFYATLLYAYGGQYRGPDGAFLFDSPQSIRAVQSMRDTIETGLSPRAVQNLERRESRQRFVAGEAIFSWDNADIITWLDDPERSEVAGRWDFMPFPATPEGRQVSVTGGFAFAANPFGRVVDETVKVLDVISQRPVQEGFALAWGPVQYYRGLYDDPVVQQYNPNVEKLTPLVGIALSRPPSENYAELAGMMREEIHSAITGTRSVEDAMANLARRAAVLERR